MAQTTISAVTIWKQGQSVSCNAFSLASIADNLTTAATFYFQVGTETESSFTSEADGNLSCSGDSYTEWQTNSFSTDWILQWGCSQLNLTKI